MFRLLSITLLAAGAFSLVSCATQNTHHRG